jgi:hypothetical protein
MRRERLLWFVPAFLALHNLEEAVTMRAALPRIRESVPTMIHGFVSSLTYSQMLSALVVVTVLPLLVTMWAMRMPESETRLWIVLVIQAVVALNVASHVAMAVMLGGYGPGLATALAINLPFSVYLFRRVVRERWISRRALWSLFPAAVLIHGPGLIGLIVLSGAIAKT